MNAFQVLYVIKKKDGFLHDHIAKFATFEDAIKFARKIQTRVMDGARLIGVPTVEKVS
jgi:hypothetical protein